LQLSNTTRLALIPPREDHLANAVGISSARKCNVDDVFASLCRQRYRASRNGAFQSSELSVSVRKIVVQFKE
jgi:hypothetical protein